MLVFAILEKFSQIFFYNFSNVATVFCCNAFTNPWDNPKFSGYFLTLLFLVIERTCQNTAQMHLLHKVKCQFSYYFHKIEKDIWSLAFMYRNYLYILDAEKFYSKQTFIFNFKTVSINCFMHGTLPVFPSNCNNNKKICNRMNKSPHAPRSMVC